MSITLALGGMRAATYVQAFQFVLKLVLFIVPAVWLLLQVGPDTRAGRADTRSSSRGSRPRRRCSSGWTPSSPSPSRPRCRSAGAPQQELAPGHYPAEAGSTWVFAAGCGRPAGGRRAPGRHGLGASAARSRRLPGARHVVACWSPRCSARWACRTSSSASTPAPTAAAPGARRRSPWRCSACSTCSRRCTGCSAPCCYPSCTSPAAPTPSWWRFPRGWTRASAGTLFTALLTAGAFAAFLATSLGLLLAVSGRPLARPGARHAAPAAVHAARRRARGGAARAAGGQPRRGGAGHVGVRGGGVHLLPAARARDLVAAADGAGAPRSAWSSACWPRRA